jgi:hypothetical protein
MLYSLLQIYLELEDIAVKLLNSIKKEPLTFLVARQHSHEVNPGNNHYSQFHPAIPR